MVSLSRVVRVLLICSIVLPVVSRTARAEEKTQLVERVDWAAFLARQDAVWTRLATSWDDAPFTGNGQLGAMVWRQADANGLDFQIGRSDVTFKGWRVPIGVMRLVPAGTLQTGTLRLDVYNAEVRGTLTTDRGTITFRTFTHADQMVQVIETSTTGTESVTWDWQPGTPTNTRRAFRKEPIIADDINLPARPEDDGDVQVSVQPLKPSGGCATAWQSVTGPRSALYLSVGFSRYGITPRTEAIGAVRMAAAQGIDNLTASHRAWWHKFWPASFLSVPDARVESFYWLQMYKMASASRPGRPVLDLMGPWFRPTPWTMIWWNLNIQLTYWPQLASNRLELGEPFIELIDTVAPALAANAREVAPDASAVSRATSYDAVGPVGDELGNLPWALHNYYLQYRYSMDESLLRRLYPVLRRSINLYLKLLTEGPDGKLHLTRGFSPEYPDQPKNNPDTNYDLALLRWGCETLLKTSKQLAIDDPLKPKWEDTLARLTPYPRDETGLRISASIPFSKSHRHFSHLMMIYPLYLMTPEEPENRELVVRSLKHWMGMPSALQGYSYTGAASISALLGDGNEALRYFNLLLDTKVLPNTMYMETGPVIETPLAAAASIHDMLLSSWGGKIRVFPGVPDAWADIVFRDLRTEGAFLVSAERRGGQTRWVRITSLAGEPCIVRPNLPGEVHATVPMRALGDGSFELSLAKGESALLSADAVPPECIVKPVDRPLAATFGLPSPASAPLPASRP